MSTTAKASRPQSSNGEVAAQRELYDLASAGALDDRVLQLISSAEGFANYQAEALEYWRELGTSPYSLAKCVATIIAMHNTFGGYLVFGVNEVEKDHRHSLLGVPRSHLDVQALRRQLSAYTGRTIEIAYSETEVPSSRSGRGTVLGLLHVPKRSPGAPPIKFGKNGPADHDGPAFKRDEVLFRLHASNARATRSEDWSFISGKRDNPYSPENPLQSLYFSRGERIVDENLPDRNIICPKFVGRNDTIVELWSWLSDDLQFAKIIAGVGGKGKTSIAYQFAEEICKNRPYGLERVIWLTAKTRQFRGLKDDFDPIEAHYSSYLELLQVLCERNALLAEEIEGATPALMKRLLKDALTQTATLIVVDDVDTLDVDDQRRVLETALLIGNRTSRFLLTTRKNFTYTDDFCIEIKGFNKDDYFVYVVELLERLGSTMRLSPPMIEKMRMTTEGSPLYTESLLRLIRNNMKPDEAIAHWKGSLGMKVRRAALDREIANISVEARRLLLVVAILAECAYTELRIITGYEDDVLLSSLDELRALFLVSANRITKTEARFSVQANTRLLVLENQRKLVSDPQAIAKKCESIRSGVSGVRTQADRKYIGGVIGQVNAFVRSGDPAAALHTAKAGLKRVKDHPDLLFALAKCHMALESPDVPSARKAYQEAHAQGQRKYQFFAAWYDCELQSRHAAGAVDVAKAALDEESNDRVEWLTKRAVAFKAWAQARLRSEDIDQALDDLKNCNSDLVAALPLAEDGQQIELRASLALVAKDVQTLADRLPRAVPSLVKYFDLLIEVFARPGERAHQALGLVATLDKLLDNLRRRVGKLTTREVNLVKQRQEAAIRFIADGRRREGASQYLEADLRLEQFSERFAAVISQFGADTAADGERAPTFDLFLAHNSADKKQVRMLAAKLQAKGVNTWLDEEQIAPGQYFQDGIQRAIPNSRALAVVIGPNGIGRWQALELRSAISQAVQRGVPVIPVYLPSAKEVGAELPFLSEFNHVIFETLDDDQALERLVWGATLRQKPDTARR